MKKSLITSGPDLVIGERTCHTCIEVRHLAVLSTCKSVIE